MNQRAIGYIRVSTAGEAAEGVSIDAQTARIPRRPQITPAIPSPSGVRPPFEVPPHTVEVVESKAMASDIAGMWVPMLTVKSDCAPHDQLRLLDAWEAWEIPLEQQWAWSVQLFGIDEPTDLSQYLASEMMYAKDNQLELSFDSATGGSLSVLAQGREPDSPSEPHQP